jgi:hypothetical protein
MTEEKREKEEKGKEESMGEKFRRDPFAAIFLGLIAILAGTFFFLANGSMNLYQFMLFYQDVFNPKYFLLLSAILIVFYDWKNSSHTVIHFFGRLVVILICYIAGFKIMDLLVQQLVEHSSNSPQYFEDFSAIAGMTIGLTLCIVLWRKLGYGRELIYGAIGLIAVSVPYTIISYFWNISGHVTFTAAPVTYLVALDRRLAPLYVIPAIMVLNRPLVGAHDTLQSVAGFIFGTSLILFVVKVLQERRGE